MTWPTNYNIAYQLWYDQWWRDQPIMTWLLANQLWHDHWPTKHFTIHMFTIEISGNGDNTATSLITSPGVGLPLVEESIPHVKICLNTSLILINKLKKSQAEALFFSLCAIREWDFVWKWVKGQVQSAKPLRANILSNMKQMHLRVSRELGIKIEHCKNAKCNI